MSSSDDKRKKRIAPIIIPTLSRDVHFIRCIESLRRNELATDTDLYVGLDYPPGKEHYKGYERISEYLESLTGFNSLTVIRHNENVGAVKNMAALRESVISRYDRFITTEDDNEFSVNYLQYMNDMLERFADNNDILAVSGYGFPIGLDPSHGETYELDTYFSALGYGTWVEKIQECRRKCNLSDFERYYKNKKMMKILRRRSPNQFCNMVKGMCGYTSEILDNDDVKKTDLTFGLYMFFENKKMIYPVVSKVRNWGYDGTGINCNDVSVNSNKMINYRNYDFSSQPLDDRDYFKYSKTEIDSSDIDRRLDGHFSTNLSERLLSDAVYKLGYKRY